MSQVSNLEATLILSPSLYDNIKKFAEGKQIKVSKLNKRPSKAGKSTAVNKTKTRPFKSRRLQRKRKPIRPKRRSIQRQRSVISSTPGRSKVSSFRNKNQNSGGRSTPSGSKIPKSSSQDETRDGKVTKAKSRSIKTRIGDGRRKVLSILKSIFDSLKSLCTCSKSLCTCKSSLGDSNLPLVRPDAYRKPAGLINLGGTCYMNSLFQCLMHTPPFREFIDQFDAEKDVSDSIQGQCVTALVNFFKELRQTEKSFLDTTNMRRVLTPRLPPPFASDTKHQDVDDFFTEFSNAVQAGLNEEESSQQTPFEKIFYSSIQSRSMCGKGHPGTTNPNYDSNEPLIRLILPPGSNNVTLTELVVNNLEEETGAECVFCLSEGGNLNELIVRQFAHLPPVLVFVIPRNVGVSKDKTPVQVERELDLTPYVPDDVENDTPRTYRRYAWIRHRGSNVKTGHYTAYARSPEDGQLYCFDDMHVAPVDEGSDIIIADDGMRHKSEPQRVTKAQKQAVMVFYLRTDLWPEEEARGAPEGDDTDVQLS